MVNTMFLKGFFSLIRQKKVGKKTEAKKLGKRGNPMEKGSVNSTNADTL